VPSSPGFFLRKLFLHDIYWYTIWQIKIFFVYYIYQKQKKDYMTEKLCKKCGETKPVEKFNRYHKSKDGLQTWCSNCRNAYQYANGEAKIYEIVNPLGERYYGATKAKLSKRFSRYKWYIENNQMGPRLLINSLITHGIENHSMTLIKNLGNIDKTEMHRIEKEYIKKYQPELNIIHRQK
jgi:hypothetical protein